MAYFFRTVICIIAMTGITYSYAAEEVPLQATQLPPAASTLPPAAQPTAIPPAAIPQPPLTTTVTPSASSATTHVVTPAAVAPVAPPGTPTFAAPPSSPQPPSRRDFQVWLQTNGQKAPPAHIPPPKKAKLPPRLVYQGHRPLTYEESQQVMLDSAPASRLPTTEESSIAFNSMLQQNMPLSPQQIVQLRQQIDVSQRAAAITPVVPPKPVSSTLMINLAPGTTPPAVRLAQGYVTSLVFIDSTGTPWPIAAFDIGNPKAVNIQWDGKSNILLLQSVLPYIDGDIVIRLVGLPTPITLELVSGQRVVDYRVDIHVSGIGPDTKELPLTTTLPNGANQLLLGILDGIPPAGGKTLMVIGADAQAYTLGEKMYLRTRFTLLSPGWIGTMVSPDGMHVYELPKTSTVLVSRYGEPAELKIEGW